MIKKLALTATTIAATIALINCADKEKADLKANNKVLSDSITTLEEQLGDSSRAINGIRKLLDAETEWKERFQETIKEIGDKSIDDYSTHPRHDTMSLAACVSAINELDRYDPFLKLSAGFSESPYSAWITIEDSTLGRWDIRKDFKFRDGHMTISHHKQYKEIIYTSPEGHWFEVGYYGSSDSKDNLWVYAANIPGAKFNYVQKYTLNLKTNDADDAVLKTTRAYYRKKRAELRKRFLAPYRIAFCDNSSVPKRIIKMKKAAR